jgi:hypothetical protein
MDSRPATDKTALIRQSAVQILKAYTRKEKTASVSFPAFAEYATRYVERYRSEYPQLEAFGKDVRAALRTAVAELAQAGQCRVDLAGDDIDRVEFPLFYLEAVRDAFKQAESAPDAPFPSEAWLGIAIPNDMVSTANAVTDIAGLLQAGESGPPIVRLLFPESLRSVVVPADTVQTRLLDLALARLRHHLGQANNAAYVQSRLAPAYHGNKALVSEMIATIALRPGSARQTIENASDSHFRFWAQLTHVIVRERRPNAEEGSGDTFQQAAHIVNAYAVGLRSAGQNKQNEARAALKAVDACFAKEPFVYTFRDLLATKDPGGAPLIRKDNHDAFIQYLKDKLRPAAGKAVPELIVLKTDDGAEHYVHRDRLIPVFLRSIPTVADETDRVLAETWEDALREGRKPPAMADDDAFADDLRAACCPAHPLFCRLLDDRLLNSVQRETKLPAAAAIELARCFDSRGERLKPLHEILGIDRRELANRVRNAVPFWTRIALLRAIVAFFKRLAPGRGAPPPLRPSRAPVAAKRPAADRQAADEDADAVPPTTVKRLAGHSDARRPAGGRPATLKQRTAVYRKDLERLRDHFVSPGKTFAAALEELAEKWNPIVETQARADLKADVDSMVRSFLRGILRRAGSMRPPDVDRIRSMAERLAANPAFDRVRNKELLRRYMELMMIKTLADEHGAHL